MVRIDTKGWVFSAALVALGLPVLAGAGLGGTVLIGVLLGSSHLGRTLAPWQVWFAGFVIAVVLMWFLARFAMRRGGWKALGAGLGISALIAAVCWFAGDMVAKYDANSMAGVGWGILAFAIGVYTLVGALVGLLVGAIETGRRAGEEMEES